MKQDPGFDVNLVVVDDYGDTILHSACQESNRSTVIPLLLAHPGIDVNVKNNGGQTPFYCACYGYTPCVREMLKDSRVKVNERNNDGITPLFWAVARRNVEMVRLLLEFGADPSLTTEKGESPLSRCKALRESGQPEAIQIADLLEKTS